MNILTAHKTEVETKETYTKATTKADLHGKLIEMWSFAARNLNRDDEAKYGENFDELAWKLRDLHRRVDEL